MLEVSFQLNIMSDLCKTVEVAAGGSVINGDTPPSLRKDPLIA